MANVVNTASALPSALGRLRGAPGAVRRVYDRGPDSLANLSIYAFGVSGLWTAVDVVLLQFRVLDIADEDQKNGILGTISLIGLIVAALTQPLAGALSDRSHSRWGRRLPYMVLGYVGLAATLPFLGVANSFLTLVLVIGLMQMLSNIAQGPTNALLTDHVPSARRGAGAGALNLARASGAGLIGVIVMGLMSRSDSGDGTSVWMWLSFGFIATMLIGTTMWTFGALRPRRPEAAAGRAGDIPGEATPTARTSAPTPLIEMEPDTRDAGDRSGIDARFYWFLVAMAMMVTALSAMQTFALFFVRDKVGLDNPVAGTAFLAIAVGLSTAVTVLPAGALSDRIGRQPLLYAAALIAAFATSGLLFVTSLFGLIALGVLIGVGTGMFLSSGWALVTELVPQRTAARSLGLTAFATLVGSGVARMSGFGIDALNRRSENLGYDVMIVVVAALLFLSIIPLRRVGSGGNGRRTEPVSMEEPSIATSI